MKQFRKERMNLKEFNRKLLVVLMVVFMLATNVVPAAHAQSIFATTDVEPTEIVETTEEENTEETNTQQEATENEEDEVESIHVEDVVDKSVNLDNLIDTSNGEESENNENSTSISVNSVMNIVEKAEEKVEAANPEINLNVVDKKAINVDASFKMPKSSTKNIKTVLKAAKSTSFLTAPAGYEDGKYYVTSWAGLKDLIENGKYNGGTTTDTTLEIVVDGKIAADSTITIPSNKTIKLSGRQNTNATIYGALDGNIDNYSINDNKYDQMFFVNGGTLELGNHLTLSGDRAVYEGDECGTTNDIPDLKDSLIFYEERGPIDLKYSKVSYQNSIVCPVNKIWNNGSDDGDWVIDSGYLKYASSLSNKKTTILGTNRAHYTSVVRYDPKSGEIIGFDEKTNGNGRFFITTKSATNNDDLYFLKAVKYSDGTGEASAVKWVHSAELGAKMGAGSTSNYKILAQAVEADPAFHWEIFSNANTDNRSQLVNLKNFDNVSGKNVYIAAKNSSYGHVQGNSYRLWYTNDVSSTCVDRPAKLFIGENDSNKTELKGVTNSSATSYNTLTTGVGSTIKVYNFASNGTYYVATSEAQSLTAGTSYYLVLNNLYLKGLANGGAQWVSWDNCVNKNMIDDAANPSTKNVQLWRYTSNGTFENLVTQEVIYFNGSTVEVVKKAKKLYDLSIGNDSDQVNVFGDDTDILKVGSGNDISLFNKASNGEYFIRGTEATSLTDNEYYYVVSNKKFLRANATGDGATWESSPYADNSASQVSKNMLDLWKYTTVTQTDAEGNSVGPSGKVLYNEKSGKVLYYNGTSVVIIDKNKITEVKQTPEKHGCRLATTPRWSSVNYTHNLSDFISANVAADSNDHSKDKGYFIKATNGATVKIAGTVIKDLKVNNKDTAANQVVTNIAPIVIDGSTFDMASGSIENNYVAYLADDTKSGQQVTGNNSYGIGLNNNYSGNGYLTTQTTPTKSAGALILNNSATANIYSDAEIKANRGDNGAIIARGSSYLVLGGKKSDNVCAPTVIGGGKINQNVGFHYAGAVLVEDGATFYMVGDDSEMNYNVTWNRGGAVWVTDFGTKGDGKGANVSWKTRPPKLLNAETNRWEKEGQFVMKAGSISYNTGFARAGAINVESNSVYLEGGLIQGNMTRSLGGAIYVEGDAAKADGVLPINVYSYTLNIKKGYIGKNYSVSHLANKQNDAVNYNFNGQNITTVGGLNNLLDRMLGATDANGNPLTGGIASGNNKTADMLMGYATGLGGALWMCSAAGVSNFNLAVDEYGNPNVVYVDDNYASTNGTELYIHPGNGQILLSALNGQKWYNQNTNDLITTKPYSGILHLINNTTNADIAGYETLKANVGGITIIDNIGREGGAIAANGNVILGTTKDIYQNEIEMDFSKIWSEITDPTGRVTTFEFFYDKDGVRQSLGDKYIVTMNGIADDVEGTAITNTSSISDDKKIWSELNPSTTAKNEVQWNATISLPNSVIVNGQPKPLFTLKSGNTVYDITSDGTDGKKGQQDFINAVLSGTTEFTIDEWNIDVEEKIDGKSPEAFILDRPTVRVSASAVNIADDTECNLRTGYQIKLSLTKFSWNSYNDEKPLVEKYINNKVHHDLATFEEKFEYEIMAYVPYNAESLIIYDTLEQPLMFWNAAGNQGQYNTVSNGIDVLNGSFNLSNGTKIVNPAHDRAIYRRVGNNHEGNTTGSVSKDLIKITNEANYTVKYIKIGTTNIKTANIPSLTNVNDADTIVVHFSKAQLDALKLYGEWVVVKFYAGIKPSYRDLDKLTSHSSFIPVTSNKQGTVFSDDDKYIEGLRDIVAQQGAYITHASRGSYMFALDSKGNVYVIANNNANNAGSAWTKVQEGSSWKNISWDDLRNNRVYGKNGPTSLDITVLPYIGQNKKTNLPVIKGTVTNSDEQHQGIQNRAGYIVNDYDALTNIVTVDINTFDITINKVDSNSSALVGAEFKLYRKDPISNLYNIEMPIVATPVDYPTQFKADNLPSGDYKLVETRVPAGKSKLFDEYTFTIDGSGKITNESITGLADVNQRVFTIKNDKQPEIEKYINNTVHQDLSVFDQVFEYSIMAYVPHGAKSIEIVDTLEAPLMFVSANEQIMQFNKGTSGDQYNTAFNNAAIVTDDSTNGFMLVLEGSNDHQVNGSVAGHSNKTSNWWNTTNTDTVLNDLINEVKIGTINNGVFTENRQGNTIRLALNENQLNKTNHHKDMHGQYIVLSFKAAIRPSYRNETILSDVGWLRDVDNKKSPSGQTELSKNYSGATKAALQLAEWVGGANIQKIHDGTLNINNRNYDAYWAKATLNNSTEYFVQLKSGDGKWYKIGVSGSKTTYTDNNGVVRGDGFVGNAEQDSSGAQLPGYNLTKDAIEAAANNVNVFYNWPVINGTEPHKGERNQAAYIVDNNRYWSNIVTLDVPKWPITIKKTDSSSKLIQGATFKLYKINGSEQVEKELNATNNGKEFVSVDLYPGRYKLVEMVAPNGFVKLANDIYFTINDKGLVELDTHPLATSTNREITVKNEETTVEKYINNVVHESLEGFDQIFEYEIVAYVPQGATELVLTDKLDESLMFYNAAKDIAQYVLSNGKDAVNSSWTKNTKIINDNINSIKVIDSNNHDGSGNGDVKNLTATSTTTITNYSISPSGVIGNNDTLTITINNINELKKAYGKYVVVRFNVGIKPSYKNLDKLKGAGWLSEEASKKGTPNNSLLGRLESYLEQNGQSINRILKKGDIYYVKTSAPHHYYQTHINGDGLWWKTEASNGATLLTATDGTVRGNVYGSNNPGTPNQGVVDTENNHLDGANNTKAVFGDYHYGAAGTELTKAELEAIGGSNNYPVVNALRVHEGVANRADYLVKVGNGEYSHKTNIVTVVVNPELYIKKVDSKGNLLTGAEFRMQRSDKYYSDLTYDGSYHYVWNDNMDPVVLKSEQNGKIHKIEKMYSANVKADYNAIPADATAKINGVYYTHIDALNYAEDITDPMEQLEFLTAIKTAGWSYQGINWYYDESINGVDEGRFGPASVSSIPLNATKDAIGSSQSNIPTGVTFRDALSNVGKFRTNEVLGNDISWLDNDGYWYVYDESVSKWAKKAGEYSSEIIEHVDNVPLTATTKYARTGEKISRQEAINSSYLYDYRDVAEAVWTIPSYGVAKLNESTNKYEVVPSTFRFKMYTYFLQETQAADGKLLNSDYFAIVNAGEGGLFDLTRYYRNDNTATVGLSDSELISFAKDEYGFYYAEIINDDFPVVIEKYDNKGQLLDGAKFSYDIYDPYSDTFVGTFGFDNTWVDSEADANIKKYIISDTTYERIGFTLEQGQYYVKKDGQYVSKNYTVNGSDVSLNFTTNKADAMVFDVNKQETSISLPTTVVTYTEDVYSGSDWNNLLSDISSLVSWDKITKGIYKPINEAHYYFVQDSDGNYYAKNVKDNGEWFLIEREGSHGGTDLFPGKDDAQNRLNNPTSYGFLLMDLAKDQREVEYYQTPIWPNGTYVIESKETGKFVGDSGSTHRINKVLPGKIIRIYESLVPAGFIKGDSIDVYVGYDGTIKLVKDPSVPTFLEENEYPANIEIVKKNGIQVIKYTNYGYYDFILDKVEKGNHNVHLADAEFEYMSEKFFKTLDGSCLYNKDLNKFAIKVGNDYKVDHDGDGIGEGETLIKAQLSHNSANNTYEFVNPITNIRYNQYHYAINTNEPYVYFTYNQANGELHIYNKGVWKTMDKTINNTTGHNLYYGIIDEGRYYVRESKAPSGYYLVDDGYLVIDFSYNSTTNVLEAVVNEDLSSPKFQNATTVNPSYTGKINLKGHLYNGQIVVVENQPYYELPSSGGIGTYYNWILGTLAITLGMYFLLTKKRASNLTIR